MKIRSGFVSNSSSSSFVIDKREVFSPILMENYLDEQREQMLKRSAERIEQGILRENFRPIFTKEDADKFIQEIFEANENLNQYEVWKIEEYKNFILFSTTMDNFDMKEYIENLLGREISYVFDIPSYCGFDHWGSDGGIALLKKMIDVGFPNRGEIDES